MSNYFQWGDACEGWHLVQSEHLSIIRERMPPGTTETLHYHERAEQVFYIVEGEEELMVADQCHAIATGGHICVPKTVPHLIANKSHQDLVFLVISSLPAETDRVECVG